MLKGHGLDGHGDLDIRLPEHLLETVEGEARFGNYLHNEESAAAAAAIAGEKRAAPAAALGLSDSIGLIDPIFRGGGGVD